MADMRTAIDALRSKFDVDLSPMDGIEFPVISCGLLYAYARLRELGLEPPIVQVTSVAFSPEEQNDNSVIISTGGYSPEYITKLKEHGYERLNVPPHPVEGFLCTIIGRKDSCRVLVDKAHNKVLVITESPAMSTTTRMDLDCAITAFLPILMPTYYESIPDIRDFCVLAKDKKRDDIKDAFYAVVERNGWIEEAVIKGLSVWAGKLNKGKLEYLRIEKERAMNTYQDRLAKAQEAAANYAAIAEECYALELYADKQDVSWAEKMFSKNKGLLKLVSIKNGDELHFTVTATIDFYNIDKMREYFDGRGEWTRQTAQLRQFIKAVFVDRVAKLRVYADFTICSMGLSFDNDRYESRASAPVDNRMPHPHLMMYNCWGANGGDISQFISERRYDMAIWQAVAATRNINVVDGTVCKTMVEYIGNHMDSLMLDYNGEIISPRQLLAAIDNNKEGK